MARLAEPAPAMTGPAPLGSAPGRSATAFAVAPLRVGFVGSGRAATALARGLRSAGAGHDLLFARRGEPARRLAAEVGGEVADPLEVLGQADVTILAVPDDALAGLVGNLAEALDGLAMSAGAGGALAPNPAAPMVPPTTSSGPAGLVVHLSGSLDAGVLAPLATRGCLTGALHPLQVLSGWRIPPGTTFAVEAPAAARPLLTRLVADLRGVELALPDGSRTAYHAAATMSANLGMAFLAEALDLMEDAGIDRGRALDGLLSLLHGGLAAAAERGLPAALTGPVSRGDVTTVRRHLDLLAADPALARAYRAASLLSLRQVERDGRPADPAAARRMRQLLDDEEVAGTETGGADAAASITKEMA